MENVRGIFGSELRLVGINKIIGMRTILRGLSLNISPGECLVILGSSGSGKSTLLRIIAGLEVADSGELWLDGIRAESLPPSERGLAMVFQSYALYHHMTVRDNLTFGLENIRLPRPEIEKRIHDVATSLEIQHLLARKPPQLSGGEKQRVALARAMVKQPRIFLFDEPFSSLDAPLRARTRLELARLRKHLQATVVLVSHDQMDAISLADRVAVLNNGEVEQIGTPSEVYMRPSTRFVATLMGSPQINLLPATILAGGEFAVALLDDGTPVPTLIPKVILPHYSGQWFLGARPESLHIVSEEDGELRVTVQLSEDFGDRSFSYVSIEGICQDRLLAISNSRVCLPIGTKIGIVFDPTKLMLFEHSGRAYHAS